MKFWIPWVMVILFGWAVPGWADVYSWVDTEGIRHFSNRPPVTDADVMRTRETPHDAAADARQTAVFKAAATEARQRQIQSAAADAEAERLAAKEREKERLAAEKARQIQEAAAAAAAAEARKSYSKRLRTRPSSSNAFFLRYPNSRDRGKTYWIGDHRRNKPHWRSKSRHHQKKLSGRHPDRNKDWRLSHRFGQPKRHKKPNGWYLYYKPGKPELYRHRR